MVCAVFVHFSDLIFVSVHSLPLAGSQLLSLRGIQTLVK